MSSYISLCSWQDKQMFAVVFRRQSYKRIGSIQQVKLKSCLPLWNPCLYGTPALTKCHDTKKIVHYSGVFAVAKQSKLRGSLGRRKGRAWRNALMSPVHPHPYFKIFSRIVGAWYWKSAILSTAPWICQHEDIWHQTGIIEWRHQRHVSRLCCISPLPPPPSRPSLFLFDPVLCPFPPLWSWFQTIQIWSQSEMEKYFEWKIMYYIS